MELEHKKRKKDYIIGIAGLIAIATLTIIGLIIKHMFFIA